ncbi:NAD-dependent epimerase/dehydratase family protein [Streptomyces seoulensis]|uniref:NAD-dependent epimerase/dehydratase family protein n=1 Tax=Streptomyces seoulensis TaxID=73044 RepID=A0A4P6TYX9_STRSO|nr:NAD-dependent epimerase/dehydratase family protein [Streptomyces seoulensis]QBJ92710.1 NAD-dependent epimerase/dehydratase family protein [Streptomyces seoulensis]
MTRRVLITGSSGFLGGHVLRAARAAEDVRLRLLVRTPPAAPHPGVEYVHGDLTDPASLRGVCADVDAVVHCAGLIGGDAELLHRANDLGTRALADEVRRAGVTRFVYLSTAAVHGRGPFRDARPGDPPVAPASDTSRTRAAAEEHVLATGGTVLRPHLVYGRGDRWVIPGILALLRTLDGLPDGWAGIQSMIDADTLGRVAFAAATRGPADGVGRVHYVTHPDPVPGELLLSTVAETFGLFAGDAPRVSAETARERVLGHPAARHHLGMLAVDHWFTDESLWSGLGVEPGAGFAVRFPEYADWYRGRAGLPPLEAGRRPGFERTY